MLNLKIERSFVYLILMTTLLSGCTVKYIAEYDASIKEETVNIAKKVDLFWGTLLDTPTSERQYENFKNKYNEIETEIRGLYMKNQIRALNESSTKQIKNLLDLWVEDKNIHKDNDTFSDFEAKRHRKQFVRVFTAIAKGEEAKNISSTKESE